MAEPLDGGLRLIFSDWLSEMGRDDLAWFVRQPSVGKWSNQTAFWGMTKSYRKWKDYSRKLLGSMPGINHLVILDDSGIAVGDHVVNRMTEIPVLSIINHKIFVTYRYGFIDQLGCKWSWFVRHGPSLLANHPVQVVRLLGIEPTMVCEEQGTASMPAWRRHGSTKCERSWLCPEVFRFLKGGSVSIVAGVKHRVYGSDLDSREDLSQALIRWCHGRWARAYGGAVREGDLNG
jgi:uncharacterized protein (TIGR02996 family)